MYGRTAEVVVRGRSRRGEKNDLFAKRTGTSIRAPSVRDLDDYTPVSDVGLAQRRSRRGALQDIPDRFA
jgi:hypothetical protein